MTATYTKSTLIRAITASCLLGLLSSCGATADATKGDGQTPDAAVQVAPEISFEPTTLTVPEGQESIAVIQGSVAGENIDLTWNFKQPTPTRQCNNLDSVLTNGAMESLPTQNLSKATIELRVESDWGTPNNCAISEGDWLIRFTIGNLNEDTVYANSKKAFSIPDEPYTMIRIQKGNDESNARRNFEYDSTNTGLTAKIESVLYDATPKTLRVIGSMRGEWSSGDHIAIDFNILVNGSDDRNLNQGSLEYTHDAGGF